MDGQPPLAPVPETYYSQNEMLDSGLSKDLPTPADHSATHIIALELTLLATSLILHTPHGIWQVSCACWLFLVHSLFITSFNDSLEFPHHCDLLLHLSLWVTASHYISLAHGESSLMTTSPGLLTSILENGEITSKSLSIITREDLITCTYAHVNNLPELEGWQ